MERLEYTPPGSGGAKAQCLVGVYFHQGNVTVVASDTDSGPSLVNNIEGIATRLRKRGLRWNYFCEHHYPNKHRPGHRRAHIFDWVTFTWTGNVASPPVWKHGTREELEALIGQRFRPRRTDVPNRHPTATP